MSSAKTIVASPRPSPKERGKKNFPFFKVLSLGGDVRRLLRLGEANQVNTILTY